jgi:hypothetical protein
MCSKKVVDVFVYSFSETLLPARTGSSNEVGLSSLQRRSGLIGLRWNIFREQNLQLERYQR